MREQVQTGEVRALPLDVQPCHSKNFRGFVHNREAPCNEMDMAWKVPQHFVARRPSPTGPGWEALVKWTNLGYDQCTWEVHFSFQRPSPSCLMSFLVLPSSLLQHLCKSQSKNPAAGLQEAPQSSLHPAIPSGRWTVMQPRRRRLHWGLRLPMHLHDYLAPLTYTVIIRRWRARACW